MAQIARTVAAKAANTDKNATVDIAELRKRTATQDDDSPRAPAQRAEDAAPCRAEAVKLALVPPKDAGTTELGRIFLDLAREQARLNLKTLQALAGAVAWDQVLEIQGAYVQASLERMGRLAQRHLQLSQTMMLPIASAARRRAGETA